MVESQVSCWERVMQFIDSGVDCVGEWYKKKQDCSGKRNSKIEQDWSDSTASWAFDIHGDDWVLIPGTQFGPLSPTRSDLWYKELGVRTEHCHVWPQMNKQTKR